MFQTHIGRFTDDSGRLRDRRTDEVKVQYKYRLVIEFGGQVFFGKFDATPSLGGERLLDNGGGLYSLVCDSDD